MHEPPYIVEGNEWVLEPGTTFSVEPGVYLEDAFGVRIEDIVAVTDDGVERLNRSTRELQVVELARPTRSAMSVERSDLRARRRCP